MRVPRKIRTSPSLIRTGILKWYSRKGCRNRSLTAGSSPSWSAIRPNCLWVISRKSKGRSFTLVCLRSIRFRARQHVPHSLDVDDHFRVGGVAFELLAKVVNIGSEVLHGSAKFWSPDLRQEVFV